VAYTFQNVTKLESSSGHNVSGSVTSTAGNALFAVVGSRGTNPTADPSVSGGGTWTSDSATHTAGGSVGISSNPNSLGGTQTITATITGQSSHGVVLFVYEFSGNPQSNIKDANSPAINSGTSAAATSNSLSNVTASALFIVGMADNNTSSTSTVTGTGSGFTYPSGGKETNASTFTAVSSGYRIVSSVVSASDAVTITSSSWLDAIAVYKAAATDVPVATLVIHAPMLYEPLLDDW